MKHEDTIYTDFFVNNRWFKINYLQDQPINLKDILYFSFPRNLWLFFNNLEKYKDNCRI